MIARPAAAVAALAFTTWVLFSFGIRNPTTAALAYLLVVLVTATTSPLWVALTTSAVAMVCFNVFFLPPVGRLTIADPENWIAFLAFVIVSLVAGHLSSAARLRASEATARREEMSRLFDLSRDILLSDQAEALAQLPRHIAARFELEGAALCLPDSAGWRIHRGGARDIAIERRSLDAALADLNARGVEAPADVLTVLKKKRTSPLSRCGSGCVPWAF